VRGSLINQAGDEVAAYAVASPPAAIHGNRCEQDSQAWLRDVEACINALRTRADLERLAAIAIDGTSSSVLLCSKDGTPLTPAIMYNDARATAQAERIQQTAPADCGAHGASSTLAKLLYFRDNFPKLAYDHVCHQADYVSAWLSGRYGISDENNCLKLGYDSIAQAWPGWLQALDIDSSTLPEVVAPGTALGKILPQQAEHFGINKECQLVSGTTDSIAALIATGAHKLGDAVTALGSTLVLKLVSRAPVFSAHYGIYSHRLGKHWLVGGASNTGGRVLREFFSQQQLDQMTTKLQPDISTGLDYYPLVSAGERFPVCDPQKLPRLAPRPDDDTRFFQAMLEGIANIEADGYAKLQQLGASKVKRVYTTGGGSKNPAWCKIRQHKLGVPVVRTAHSEASMGAAMLARQGWQQ